MMQFIFILVVGSFFSGLIIEASNKPHKSASYPNNWFYAIAQFQKRPFLPLPIIIEKNFEELGDDLNRAKKILYNSKKHSGAIFSEAFEKRKKILQKLFFSEEIERAESPLSFKLYADFDSDDGVEVDFDTLRIFLGESDAVSPRLDEHEDDLS